MIRVDLWARCGPKWSHTKLSNLHVQSAPDNRDALHWGLGFRVSGNIGIMENYIEATILGLGWTVLGGGGDSVGQ